MATAKEKRKYDKSDSPAIGKLLKKKSPVRRQDRDRAIAEEAWIAAEESMCSDHNGNGYMSQDFDEWWDQKTQQHSKKEDL